MKIPNQSKETFAKFVKLKSEALAISKQMDTLKTELLASVPLETVGEFVLADGNGDEFATVTVNLIPERVQTVKAHYRANIR